MKLQSIPTELRSFIDSETPDFIVESRRNYPRKKGLSYLIFSLLWLGFTSIFVFAFIAPVFWGEEVHFKTNDVPTTASLENWKPLIGPGLLIGVFVVAGIGMFVWALIQYFQKGGYFVGTETRLIKYRNGEITVKDWEQFSGNIKVKSKIEYGDLELELRTGKMKSRDSGADRFVPDIVYITEIENVFDIEKKCRTRIKENDPTPATKAAKG